MVSNEKQWKLHEQIDLVGGKRMTISNRVCKEYKEMRTTTQRSVFMTLLCITRKLYDGFEFFFLLSFIHSIEVIVLN